MLRLEMSGRARGRGLWGKWRGRFDGVALCCIVAWKGGMGGVCFHGEWCCIALRCCREGTLFKRYACAWGIVVQEC
jgi:hypothetical protein